MGWIIVVCLLVSIPIIIILFSMYKSAMSKKRAFVKWKNLPFLPAETVIICSAGEWPQKYQEFLNNLKDYQGMNGWIYFTKTYHDGNNHYIKIIKEVDRDG